MNFASPAARGFSARGFDPPARVDALLILSSFNAFFNIKLLISQESCAALGSREAEHFFSPEIITLFHERRDIAHPHGVIPGALG